MQVRQPRVAPGWALARPRLLAALAEANCSLILLRAGAGYGKTLLARQWAASRSGACWCDLAGERFEEIEGWESAAGDLILDGYAPGVPGLDEAVSALLDRCPEGRHVLILSRAQPDLDLGRRRIEGTVFELGAFELAFSRDEVRDLVCRAARIDCDEASLDELMSRTLGWPAAVRMAIYGMSGADSRSLGPISGADGPMAHYLQTEIWRQLDGDQREFALATSLLEEFQPEWCDGISECGGGVRMVRELRAAESWLLPPRKVGEGFRHHPLVREFFLAHLREEPAKRRELETRSARTLSSNRRTVEATEVALNAEAWELAIECLRRGADRAFRQGQGERLRTNLARFPLSYRDRPELLRIDGYLAWASGDLEVARIKASRAAETQDVDLRADALILRAAVHYAQGEFAEELSALQESIDLCPGDQHILGKAWFGLGSLHFRAGRISEAEGALQQAAALTHEGEPAHAAVLSVLALLPLSRGTPRAALPGLIRAVASNRKAGNRRGEAHACYHLAIALNQSGMHQRALDTLAEAERLGHELGLAHLGALVARETADAHRDLGTGEASQRYRDVIASMESLGAASGLLHAYHGLSVHLRREHDREAARRAAEKALAHAASGDPAFVSLVRLHLALLSPDPGAFQERFKEALQFPHRYYRALALLYAAAGDRTTARQRAQEAHALIQDEGFEHLLLEEQALAAPWLGTQSPVPTLAPVVRTQQRFKLYLLDGISLQGPDGEALRIRPQALKLLAYLALRRGATVEPEQLIDALWPQRGNEMRPTMQTLVWLLRRNVHERLVVTRATGYAFDPDKLVWLDIEEFAQNLREKRFAESVEIYRGELLPGVDWADLERRHLENRFLHALEVLAEEHCEKGRSEEGIALYERIIAIDPLAEDAYRRLIACHEKAGREDAAERLRREFAQRLERELSLSDR